MEELPETLIHHIQSFLSAKNAAQTSILSKSWGSAWSTRPTIDLDFSEYHPRHHHEDQLCEFAKNTFRRYDESNLNINTFRLCLKDEWYVRLGFAEKWTWKALKLGATDLTLRLPNSDIATTFTDKVNAGSENVVKLCLQSLKIIDGLKVLKCTSLIKSLTLSNLTMNTNQFFDILSCFPLIEYLSLSDIQTTYAHDLDIVDTRPPPIIQLLKLRSLVLSEFESLFQMKRVFLDDLSLKFPNLKDLTLVLIISHDVIGNISSATLETLNLRYVDDDERDIARNTTVSFDVPSIRKFTFDGSCMPELCFIPTPRGQWDSYVSIRNHHGDMSNTWFYELSKFVTKLKVVYSSKIHLCLRLNFNVGFDYVVGEVDGLHVFEVDELTLDMKDLPSFSCYAVLDGLFRICHPQMMKMRGEDDVGKNNNNKRNNDLLICQLIEQGMQLKSVLLIPTQLMYGLRNLEELDAQQLFDGVWKSQPLGCILDDLQRRFRFHLKWKPSPNNKFKRRRLDDDDMHN